MSATHPESRYQGEDLTNRSPHYSRYESCRVEPSAHAPVMYPTPIPTARFLRTGNGQPGPEDYLPLGATLGPRVSQQASNESTQQSTDEETVLLDENHLSELSRESSPNRQPEPRDDPFRPFPIAGDIIEQENPLTFRAVFLGILFGSLVNVAELYSGLRSGLAIGASICAPIISFAIIKGLTKIVPHINWLGGPFGPRETAIVNAAAVGAAGTAQIFATLVPGMFKLRLLTSASSAFGPLLALSLMCTFGGLFSAAPLREFFIVRSARELNLRFPESEATAMTIRAMHEAGAGALQGMRRFKALAIAFAAAFAQKIAAQYAPGLVYDWHFFTWIYEWSNYTNGALSVESWGWYFELTPSFWGFGMLVGLNMGASMLFGSILAYGIVGPVLVHLGAAAGSQQPAAVGAGPQWKNYMSFTGSGSTSPSGTYTPSPYFWNIWPGIAMIACSSVTELALHLPSFMRGAKVASKAMGQGLLQKFHHAKTNYDPYGDHIQQAIREDDESAGKDVTFLVWLPGLLAVTAMACLIAVFQWHTNAGWIVLALLLSAFLGFLNIYGAGTVGVAPPISEFFVLILFSGIALSTSDPLPEKLTLVLIAGVVVVGVSGVANSLIGDYRNGYLLRVPPRAQFAAQAIGTLASGVTATGMFTLFAAAYPCMLDPAATATTCPVSAQMAMQNVAMLSALLRGGAANMVPTGALVFAGVMGALAVATSVACHFLLRGERARYRKFVPNWMAVGISFALPYTYVSTAVFVGALVAHFWRKKWPSQFELYGTAVAAGLISGESLGGVAGGILDATGVGGERYAIGAGCPANRCA